MKIFCNKECVSITKFFYTDKVIKSQGVSEKTFVNQQRRKMLSLRERYHAVE
jgi:hypothetical protein